MGLAMSETATVRSGLLARSNVPGLPAIYRPRSRDANNRTAMVFGLVGGTGMFLAMANPGPWAALASLGIFTVVPIWLIGRGVRMFRISRLWGERHSDGMALLGANRLDEAEKVFEDLCHKCRASPYLHAMSVQYRAMVDLHRGSFDRSAALLQSVIDSGWIQGRRGLMNYHYPVVLGQLAVVRGLQGRTADATELLAEARHRLSEPRKASLLLVEAIVLAREERFDDVIATIDARWSDAEAQLTPVNMRALRLIEAYALERRAGGNYRAEANDSDARRALGGARPFRPGEFDYLVAEWPELREFLQAHGFVKRDAERA